MPTVEIIEQFKTCAKCGEAKDVKCFYPCANGFSDKCRKCRNRNSNTQKIEGDKKQCSTCREMKPFSEFMVNAKSSSGLSSQCHVCRRRGWRKRNPINPDKFAITLPGEEWRDVIGAEGEFAVSNLGRVKRVTGIRRTFAERLLTPNLANIGYYTVGIHGKTVLIHRLVADAFLDPDPSRPEVNHKSGVRTDNRPSNLEWVTHQENMVHATSVLKKGARKLTEDQVREMRRKFSTGQYTRTALAAEYDVARPTATRAIDRVFWKHVE